MTETPVGTDRLATAGAITGALAAAISLVFPLGFAIGAVAIFLSGIREATIDDLREEYLARGHAKNLDPRTIEWYERHSGAFRDWCSARGIVAASTEPRSGKLGPLRTFCREGYVSTRSTSRPSLTFGL